MFVDRGRLGKSAGGVVKMTGGRWANFSIEEISMWDCCHRPGELFWDFVGSSFP